MTNEEKIKKFAHLANELADDILYYGGQRLTQEHDVETREACEDARKLIQCARNRLDMLLDPEKHAFNYHAWMKAFIKEYAEREEQK